MKASSFPFYPVCTAFWRDDAWTGQKNEKYAVLNALKFFILY
jgi:hypothetical protein